MTRFPTIIAGRVNDAAQRFVSAAAPIVKGGYADLLVLGGIAAIARGLGLIAPPAAWIFVGIVAIVIGLRGVHGGQD